nr:atherin-like [Aegilops tauschii subsp. strangulata]
MSAPPPSDNRRLPRVPAAVSTAPPSRGPARPAAGPAARHPRAAHPSRAASPPRAACLRRRHPSPLSPARRLASGQIPPRSGDPAAPRRLSCSPPAGSGEIQPGGASPPHPELAGGARRPR